MIFSYDQKVVPYVRMTRRGKYVRQTAKDYLASKENLSWSFKAQMAENGYEKIGKRTPFEIEILYFAPNIFQFDLDNLVKAVLDAGNGIIYPDDRWCQEITHALKTRGTDFYLELKIVENDS